MSSYTGVENRAEEERGPGPGVGFEGWPRCASDNRERGLQRSEGGGKC